MRRIFLLLFAANSLAIGVHAATRPHYGGTLHVTTAGTLVSLDPAEPRQSNSIAGRNVFRLLFDTLVTLDARGVPQAALAVSWRADSSNQRWRFVLRRGVSFSDGSPLTSDAAAASLRRANPNWKVTSDGEAIVIEIDSPDPELPAELVLARNSIVRRDGKLLGTGPFVLSQWDSGKKITLTARDDYWDSRAYLDSVEIELGRGLREQMIALDLGHADLIEVAPEQSRWATTEGRHVSRSAPVELMAIVFASAPRSVEEGRLREALSLSLDRSQINQVLLQGGGEVSAAPLPNWMTGYSFLFPTDPDLRQANQIRSEFKKIPAWTLGYDPGDTVARVVSERIALNARNAGLTVQPTASGPADARLVRIPLTSLDARVALMELASALGLPQPKLQNASAESLYSAENSLLQTRRVIPLLHLRAVSGMSAQLQGWSGETNGGWHLTDVWLTMEKP